jgi:polysaccharide pyruvyl transferase WcaK-like protein
MKVYHIYARNYNFGDHALGLAVRNLFRRYFNNNVIFVPFDTHNLWISRKDLLFMNKDADLILVGGGGLIHGFGLGAHAWMFHLPSRLLKYLRVPIVFFSVGYNQFRNQPALNKSILKNLNKLSNKALGFSVRNDNSLHFLKKQGFACDEIPDPGFFLDKDYKMPNIDAPYVICQLAYDNPASRGINVENLIESVCSACRYLFQKGIKVILAPHCKPDIEISEIVYSELKSDGDIHIWDYYRSISDDHIEEHLALYKHADFVIAMRGHAQIIPYGMGVPFVTIINHSKHKNLADNLGMGRYCVEIGSQDLKVSLIDTIKRLESDRERVKTLISETMIEYNKQVSDYMGSLKEKYNSTPNDQRFTLCDKIYWKIMKKIKKIDYKYFS